MVYPACRRGWWSSALAHGQQRPLVVIAATLEEAGRWATQLEAMNWHTVHFYPTSEASPYDPFDQESEMTWGQLQVLADLLALRSDGESGKNRHHRHRTGAAAPPAARFYARNLLPEGWAPEQEINLKTLSQKLAQLGYEKVVTCETEGQWAQRGDIIDVYPVASELPVRLELFGDELERLREFDPSTQRSLDNIDHLVLTPTDYGPIIMEQLRQQEKLDAVTFRSSPGRVSRGHFAGRHAPLVGAGL
jgi:transcription-repair coupling factor (superfamily II helicase)